MGIEAEALAPIGASCAVIKWPLPPPDADGGITTEAADTLCAALLCAGSLAFRWDDEMPPPSDGNTRYFPAPTQSRSPRSWLGHLRDALRLLDIPPVEGMPYSVLTTSEPAAARLLFTHTGWTLSEQIVLAYSPALRDPTTIVQPLQQDRDWRRNRLPLGARLLFGLGHDGAFGVIAAADASTLQRFLIDLGIQA